MLLARMKQVYVYFFGHFTELMEKEVQKILETEEFKVFLQMDEYDKIHSYQLWKKVQKSPLQSELLYQKLSLLHDCGKEHKNFVSRCSTVVFDVQRKWDKHPECAYEKLQDINEELALLCLQHHRKPESKEMALFQELDNT